MIQQRSFVSFVFFDASDIDPVRTVNILAIGSRRHG